MEDKELLTDHLPRIYNKEALIRILLLAIGEDIDRPGLKDTPKRVARFWDEFINYDPGNHATAFESTTVDQMVVVSGIRVWSLCEHHLLPFWCDLTIGYLTTNKVLGLSKFARIAHKWAHQLQIQERLVSQIADDIQRLTESDSVGVLGTGVHTCMVMRGIKTDGRMTTSVLRGAFKDNPDTRQEFMELHTH